MTFEKLYYKVLEENINSDNSLNVRWIVSFLKGWDVYLDIIAR